MTQLECSRSSSSSASLSLYPVELRMLILVVMSLWWHHRQSQANYLRETSSIACSTAYYHHDFAMQWACMYVVVRGWAFLGCNYFKWMNTKGCVRLVISNNRFQTKCNNEPHTSASYQSPPGGCTHGLVGRYIHTHIYIYNTYKITHNHHTLL